MYVTLITYAVAIVLAWPLGQYLAQIMRGNSMRSDPLFAWIEGPIYRLIGTDPQQSMTVRQYIGAFLIRNAVIGGLVFGIFMLQAWLPLNPNHVANMRWDTALHTMVSFLTNTDQQHYSGQSQLSYFSQMTGVVGLQFISPMMGLALVVATLRALFADNAPPPAAQTVASITIYVGNYWADVIRPSIRFLLPLCLLLTVVLGSQGVPSTLRANVMAKPLDQHAGLSQQQIPLGPVAAMVAVKQLGTNGGGWYGPNSAMAFENPTPLTNAVESIAILLIPLAVVLMLGRLCSDGKRLITLVFASMLIMSCISTALMLWTEQHGVAPHALMEGKEVRIGAPASALWAALTTQTSNGSVNTMHDSLAPLSGLIAIINMLINAIWGGIGCGLQQFIVYLILTVFLAGLMTGRTPEIFGRKIQVREVQYLALLILLQPIVVLGMTALTLSFPQLAANSNPGFHGISQVFYEYTSAFSNNGSGFEGLNDSSYWWNLTCTAVMILGRYPALILPLLLTAGLAAKPRTPTSSGTLQIQTPTFALTLIGVIVILTVLQFMPAVVIGPIAEHLAFSAS